MIPPLIPRIQAQVEWVWHDGSRHPRPFSMPWSPLPNDRGAPYTDIRGAAAEALARLATAERQVESKRSVYRVGGEIILMDSIDLIDIRIGDGKLTAKDGLTREQAEALANSPRPRQRYSDEFKRYDHQIWMQDRANRDAARRNKGGYPLSLIHI